MVTLIIGGAASGKSEYAERHVMSRPGQRIYLATMQPFDQECRTRIEKHRTMRRDKQFETVECYTNLPAVRVPEESNVLLECMSNLVANELYTPKGKGADAALEGVACLMKQCGELTIVTNEVFSGGMDYEGDTLFYLRELARVNRVLAGWADRVVEVICGLPNVLKGTGVWV